MSLDGNKNDSTKKKYKRRRKSTTELELRAKIGNKLQEYKGRTQYKEVVGSKSPAVGSFQNAECGMNITLKTLLTILEVYGKSLLDLAHDISIGGFVEFLLRKDYIIRVKDDWHIGPALHRLLEEYTNSEK